MPLGTFSEASEQDLYREVEGLLRTHGDHPLKDALERVLRLCRAQSDRMERLIRISDGYHGLSRQHGETLAKQYDRQIRHLEKILRISDRYQQELRQLGKMYEEAAFHDPLTGIGNRRYLMARLKEETVRATRKGGGYALLLIDADHFKAVNDRYGHDIGDRALCAIAEAMQSVLRDFDICGRWGGEEFLVLLPEAPLELAGEVGERVRGAVGAIDLVPPQGRLSLTVSVGASVFLLGESHEESIKRADEALYRAKAAGRNRVEIFMGEVSGLGD